MLNAMMETYSTVWKGTKENQEHTNGDYYIDEMCYGKKYYVFLQFHYFSTKTNYWKWNYFACNLSTKILLP